MHGLCHPSVVAEVSMHDDLRALDARQMVTVGQIVTICRSRCSGLGRPKMLR